MILYALTIVVSAFLLFQVQPVIAKIILPWFGGSAAVWTTCLLFFQTVLLLGYLYAHATIRYLKPRMQMLVHAGLLLVSAAVLPIYPSANWKPYGNEDPSLRILGLLAGIKARCRTGCMRSRTRGRCSRCSAIRCCSSRYTRPDNRRRSGRWRT